MRVPDLAAIEIYPGGATPAQYADGCGAIVVWTGYVGEDRPR